MEIGKREIGLQHPPGVIAEMPANHNGRIETAFQVIQEAKVAGADAVKIQTYRPATMTLECDSPDFLIRGTLREGKTLYELYEWAHTPWEWHAQLFELANKIVLIIFNSPFDATAVDLLEDLNAPAYKIASSGAVDLPLIRYVAGTGKPINISAGMANAEEVQEAIEAACDGGCRELAILHCVSGYPTEDYNLRTIPDLIERFGLVTGLSDHTLDNSTAIASAAHGASIIEKHFTLDRNGGGPDDSFSLEPAELSSLTRNVRTAWNALGKVDYGRKSSEQGNVQFRRSLYFVKNMSPGDLVTADSIRSIRPGFGLSPKYLDKCVGRRVIKSVKIGTPVKWDILNDIIEKSK